MCYWCSKRQRVSGPGKSAANDDNTSIKDLRDVTRIANIDLKEEQERFIQDSQHATVVMPQVYHVEETTHLAPNLAALKSVILRRGMSPPNQHLQHV
jgi:hypothetical protein